MLMNGRTIFASAARQGIGRSSTADPLQVERDFSACQAMGRLVTVDDLTPMVTYLLSDANTYVTGQAYLVYGEVTI